MNNRMHKAAKILTLIPIIVFALNAVCLGALAINYFSTGSDPAAMAFIFAASMSFLFTTVPCLVMAVLGTVFAARSQKEGCAQSGKFRVLGIIEIVVYGLGLAGTFISAFITILAVIG